MSGQSPEEPPVAIWVENVGQFAPGAHYAILTGPGQARIADAFLVRLNSSGTSTYSKFVGGSGRELAYTLDLDSLPGRQ